MLVEMLVFKFNYFSCVSDLTTAIQNEVAWLSYFENSPAEKGNISYEELSYIERDLEQTPDKAKVSLKEIPWGKIWTCPPFIVVVLTGFFASIIDFVIMDMMPQYLKFVQFWLQKIFFTCCRSLNLAKK